MPVLMSLTRILIRENADAHVVELTEVDGDRTFPIVIGLNEAAAIERRLMGQEPPRPQTHELLADVVQSLGARIQEVRISELKNHTFYAVLLLARGDETIEIDSRPSDAIALGIATEVPIYVDEAVLDEVCGESG